VSVSLDGSVAEFTYANRSGFDLACSNQPPVSGRVVIRHPAGWPPQLLLEAEGRWPYNPAGTTYADVWDVMDGVVTQ
jgi:hypothetical protein